MRILIKSVLFLFILINNSNAKLIKPNSNLKPFAVLLIQLNSLKNNNVPYKDAGIEQTWEFAHPNNKKITGPLKKFKQMIYSNNYEILIGHENSKIIIYKTIGERTGSKEGITISLIAALVKRSTSLP